MKTSINLFTTILISSLLFTFGCGEEDTTATPTKEQQDLTPKDDKDIVELKLQDIDVQVFQNQEKTFKIENDALEIEAVELKVVKSPERGTLELTDDKGELKYTPEAEFLGQDFAEFKIVLGDKSSNTAKVTINIVEDPSIVKNVAPLAKASTAEVDEDSDVLITLKVEDEDVSSLTYNIVTQPSQGTLTATETTGEYSYAPHENYNGEDSFVFIVNDGEFDSQEAVVTINVAAVNDQPTSENQNFSVRVGETLSGQLTASDIDEDDLTFALVTGPAEGILSAFNADGSFEYTPALASGSMTFTFKVNDGTEDSVEYTTTIAVGGFNFAGTWEIHDHDQGDNCDTPTLEISVSETELVLNERRYVCGNSTKTFGDNNDRYDIEGTNIKIGNAIVGSITDTRLSISISSGSFSTNFEIEFDGSQVSYSESFSISGFGDSAEGRLQRPASN